MYKCNSTTKWGTKMQTSITGLVQILQPWENNHEGHTAHMEEVHHTHHFQNHKGKLMASTARKTGLKHEASLTCCWLKPSHEPAARHKVWLWWYRLQQLSSWQMPHTSMFSAHISLATALETHLLPKSTWHLPVWKLPAANYLPSFIYLPLFQHPKLKTAVVRQGFWRSREQWFHTSEMPSENNQPTKWINK